MYLYLVYIFIYYHDLFISNRAHDENNFNILRDNQHTYQFNCDDTSNKESFNQDYIVNNSNTTLTKNDSNELVIIDYPYKFKNPKLPQLFIEKTDQPIHRPFSPFNIKQVPHKDIKSNSNDNDNNDLNNTLNDEYENRSNNNKQNYKESIDPNQMKTEDTYVTKESNVKNESIITTNNRSTQVLPLKKIYQHCKTHRQKNTTTNKPKALESHRCPMLQIKEKEAVYCIYCEEMYKNCALNNTDLPLNKTCINCEKPICNEALELYKKNNLIEQYSDKSKTTRNTQCNPPNKVASFIKSLTIVKGKKGIIKVNRRDSSTLNSNNSSLIREKELFKKKYSFLHVQNQSINSNKREKEKENEKDKSINVESTFKENHKRGNNNNNNNSLKKHCPMKLTIALSGKK